MIDLRLACIISLGIVLAPAPLLAAGNVTVETKAGKLVIVGDADDNVIAIDQMGLGADEFRVTPTNTSVNGSASAATFSGVTSDILFDLGAGADEVDFTAATVPGNVRLPRRRR